LLGKQFRISLTQGWDGAPADAMIALHARRSAASIQDFATMFPDRPLVVALTGTDLYRDIESDPAAQRSLALATRLVVLNERAPQRVPAALRRKCVVILQSARALRRAQKPVRSFRIAVVGHLRDEKNPQQIWRLLPRLPRELSLRIDHVGAALAPHFARAALTAAARDERYRWHGNLPRAQTRQLIRHSHLLLHPSRLEGGAAVIIEALTAHTPVIASRIDGHIGLLGASYPGLFEFDDDVMATRMIEDVARHPRAYARLNRAGEQRARLFLPERERSTWLRLLESLNLN
jgi:putative glycosyltransferase (TIGR04348 family)